MSILLLSTVCWLLHRASLCKWGRTTVEKNRQRENRTWNKQKLLRPDYNVCALKGKQPQKHDATVINILQHAMVFFLCANSKKLCICNWLYSDDAHIHLWSVALRWVLLFQMFWWFPCAKNAGPDTGGLPEKRPAAFSLSLAANKHTYDTKINNTFSIQFVNLSPNLDLDYICIHLFLLQIIIKI